jgi:hypothetical protein
MKTAQNNKVSAYDLMYAKDCNTGYQSAEMDAIECRNDNNENISTFESFDCMYYQCTKPITPYYFDLLDISKHTTIEIYIQKNRLAIIDYLFNGLPNFGNRLLTENFSIEFFNLLNLNQRKKVCKIVLDAWNNQKLVSVNKYLYNAIRFYKLV